jgi:DNA end-binding protein Ku
LPVSIEDTYHADLMRRIKEKISKGETRQTSAPERGERQRPSAQVIDLTALLKESLKGGERVGRKPPKRAEASTAARSATHSGPTSRGKPRAATRRKRA